MNNTSGPSGNIEYQPVEPKPKNWATVDVPGDLKSYDLKDIRSVRDHLEVLNNWCEWLSAWVAEADARIAKLEPKQPSGDPPGGKYPPPPPPFG